MHEWIPIVVALMCTGVVAGILAGLLGVGGGIVIVPVLYLILQSLEISPATAMLIATGTSLMTIVPTSIASALAHHKCGNVDFNLLQRWSLPMLVGVLLGSLVATRVAGIVLMIVFGSLALLVALNMLFRANAPASRDTLPIPPVQYGLAGGIGLLSVMMGIGGGTLGVPTMTFFNVSTHRAIGTAALFGLVIALPGSLMMLFAATTPIAAPIGTFGMVNLPGFFLIVPLTILFAPVGVKIGSRLDARVLKKIFALFLLLVGSRMIWQTLSN
jgi:uncharacterized membrane protein YfcA